MGEFVFLSHGTPPVETTEYHAGATASLPRPEVFHLLAFPASQLILTAGMFQRELNRGVQPRLIVLVERDEAKGLLAPGDWAQHFC